ncbi:histidyl-tRNA synthetase, partial [Coemansia reversa NRRL 1564]
QLTGQSTLQYTMQQTPRAVRGMVDRIGLASRKHQHIIDKARKVVEAFGFEPIQTPILEYSSVFERTLGKDSDVVGKELYKFLDSSEQWMTMRPEATASVARALITNNLEQNLPQKLYYFGPMFRHERPQKGRLRQFEQFGVEAVGIGHPAIDVECIKMGWQFLNSLNTTGELQLQLNTLGDSKSRLAYRSALRDYFEKHRNYLSEDSQRRLDTNPLRIMDSKDKADIEVSQLAPTYAEFLSPESHRHFDFVRHGLEALDIPFTLNSRLVRGLDYYQHTVWEVACASDRLGRSQATVLAGGRYDGLTGALGGIRSLPGIGWATGIERLALLLDNSEIPQRQPPIPVLAVPE